MQAVSKYSRNRRFVTTTTFCNRIDCAFSTIQPFDENMEFIPLEQRHPDVLLFRGFIKDQTYTLPKYIEMEVIDKNRNICFLVKIFQIFHEAASS